MTRHDIRTFLSFRPFTGRHMLVVVLLFFGTIIAVNVGLAVEASRSWTGLLAKNGYVASQEFNERLAAAEAARAWGWRVEAAAADGRLAIAALGPEGRPIHRAVVSARVERPVGDREDHAVALVAGGGGRWRAAERLAPGLWHVIVDIDAGPRHVTRRFRLFVAAGT